MVEWGACLGPRRLVGPVLQMLRGIDIDQVVGVVGHPIQSPCRLPMTPLPGAEFTLPSAYLRYCSATEQNRVAGLTIHPRADKFNVGLSMLVGPDQGDEILNFQRGHINRDNKSGVDALGKSGNPKLE